MKLFNKLFGREQRLNPDSLPPEFRPIAAILPKLPLEQRRTMETLLTKATNAGVSTLNEMDVFLETQSTYVVLQWANTLMRLIK